MMNACINEKNQTYGELKNKYRTCIQIKLTMDITSLDFKNVMEKMKLVCSVKSKNLCIACDENKYVRFITNMQFDLSLENDSSIVYKYSPKKSENQINVFFGSNSRKNALKVDEILMFLQYAKEDWNARSCKINNRHALTGAERAVQDSDTNEDINDFYRFDDLVDFEKCMEKYTTKCGYVCRTFSCWSCKNEFDVDSFNINGIMHTAHDLLAQIIKTNTLTCCEECREKKCTQVYTKNPKKIKVGPR